MKRRTARNARAQSAGSPESRFAVTMTAQKQAPLPGTRPTGTTDERDASARVREMLTRIAPRYDFLNHLLSFSLDRIWRRRTAQLFTHILERPEARVLDLCCGTGDLTFALDRARTAALGDSPQRSPIIGSDFVRSEEHTSDLQSRFDLVCRLLLV